MSEATAPAEAAPKGPRKVTKKVAPKKVTKKAAPKTKTKAEPDPNMVTLAELCQAAKVEPMTARRYLRNSKIEMGTDARWTWKKGSKAVADVKKLLADIGK